MNLKLSSHMRGEFVSGLNPAERKLGQLCSDLTYTRVDEIVESGLHEYLDNLQTRLNEVGKETYDTFFARKVPVAAKREAYRPGSESDQVFIGAQSQE